MSPRSWSGRLLQFLLPGEFPVFFTRKARGIVYSRGPSPLSLKIKRQAFKHWPTFGKTAPQYKTSVKSFLDGVFNCLFLSLEKQSRVLRSIRTRLDSNFLYLYRFPWSLPLHSPASASTFRRLPLLWIHEVLLGYSLGPVGYRHS